jgi:4-aminobutyrate aminotransferase/(S)-3-amino-2-methylpropionate transaminase
MPKSIVRTTAIPGPRSQALFARRSAAIPRGVSNTVPIFAAQAHGALLTDVDGNVYIDFAGGIGTLNVGHTHDAVVEAAQRQIETLTHTCFAIAGYEPYVALCEKLNAIAPGPGAKKTVLGNSGAEAVENAVKIARHATGRQAVVVYEHGFHGRTLMTLTMTSKAKPYKLGFGPFMPEVYRLPYPYLYRRTTPATAAAYEAELREFFDTHVAAERVACVVIEPVLGEGGFIPAPADYLAVLARICRENGILLVADEVQTGFCRTGRMFASEHSGLEPDLVVTAKSLGGGLPISAVTGRAEVMDSAQPGGLGGTFVGNPVACAAALAAIEVMERDGLAARATAIGERVGARFAQFQESLPAVGDARGLGAMRALELVKDKVSKEFDKEKTLAVVRRAAELGVLLVTAGTHGNIVRTLMPLVISDEQLDEGLDVLEQALQ